MMLNKIGREIPNKVQGFGEIKPYNGPFAEVKMGTVYGRKVTRVKPNDSKMLESIEEAIKKTGLKDGMTISFHHHFREGDYILNMVIDAIAKMGIKNLTLASSSLNNVHASLVKYIKDGVITSITTSGLRGTLADEISNGLMENPVIIRSHGGRARAIECGDIKIDVAFLGVPSCDNYGNANGYNGKSFCGSLGYAKIDAKYAENVVLITDNLVPYPNVPASISQTDVDYIVQVEAIGNPQGIVSGATRYTKNPKELLIAKYAAKVIEASGYLVDGFSMQTGSGGAALAVAIKSKNKEIKQVLY